MVPAPIVRRLLDGVKKKKLPDVPGMGISTQPLENPALRMHLGMKKKDSGVLITAVQYGSSAWGKFEVGDVLMELDGHSIADNGTIRYRARYRCQFDAVIGDYHCGEVIKARVLHKGKAKEGKGKGKSKSGKGSQNPDGFAKRTFGSGDVSDWSKLRDRERDPAFNAIKEKFPARYKELVEQYYKSFQKSRSR